MLKTKLMMHSSTELH